jgi:glutamate synthase domain-containing protein 1
LKSQSSSDALVTLQEVERDHDIVLPPVGQYAVGNVFFKPRDEPTLAEHKAAFESIAESLNLRVLTWRDVPRDNSILGPAALSREPRIIQPFVVLATSYGHGKSPEGKSFDDKYFARQLYVLRKHATHTITLANWFYVCSLSPTCIVYKGQLSPPQVRRRLFGILARVYFYFGGNRCTITITISITSFSHRTFVSFTLASQPTRSLAGIAPSR